METISYWSWQEYPATVEVTPVKGLADAYRAADGSTLRILPNGDLHRGYIGGLQLGTRAAITEPDSA
jgi:hypothetical protein